MDYLSECIGENCIKPIKKIISPAKYTKKSQLKYLSPEDILRLPINEVSEDILNDIQLNELQLKALNRLLSHKRTGVPMTEKMIDRYITNYIKDEQAVNELVNKARLESLEERYKKLKKDGGRKSRKHRKGTMHRKKSMRKKHGKSHKRKSSVRK